MASPSQPVGGPARARQLVLLRPRRASRRGSSRPASTPAVVATGDQLPVPIARPASGPVLRWGYRAVLRDAGLRRAWPSGSASTRTRTRRRSAGCSRPSPPARRPGLALRSMPRAVPLVALGLAVLLGGAGSRRSVVASPALADAVRPGGGVRPRRASTWRRCSRASSSTTTSQRPESAPAYWRRRRLHRPQARTTPACWSSRRRLRPLPLGHDPRPVPPGLTDRPFVARELIPYGGGVRRPAPGARRGGCRRACSSRLAGSARPVDERGRRLSFAPTCSTSGSALPVPHRRGRSSPHRSRPGCGAGHVRAGRAGEAGDPAHRRDQPRPRRLRSPTRPRWGVRGGGHRPDRAGRAGRRAAAGLRRRSGPRRRGRCRDPRRPAGAGALHRHVRDPTERAAGRSRTAPTCS